MRPVTHLHFHSEFSLQDSLIRIDRVEPLVEQFNIKALALTDHGNVDGAVKFYQAVKKTKAVPILGCEFYVVDDLKIKEDKHRYHMVALAKNRAGFTSIMRALTVANLEGFYYRPRIDWDYIFENLHDVVIMTACTEGILSHPKWDDLLGRFVEKYGDDFYLEAIMLRDYKPQHAVNAMVKELQSSMGLKVAFTGDVHYVDKSNWKARNVVYAIGNNKRINPNMKPDPDQADIHLKSYDEMAAAMHLFGWEDETEMVRVWDEITDKCTFALEQREPTIPIAYPEAKADPSTYLIKVVNDMLNENFPELSNDHKVQDRLVYELDQIIELGFAEYFLLVQDMIHWAKTHGCRVGPGRGSVGGSLVAYIMGITDVNPLEYDLVFERFISPGRHDLPDIDIDFEDCERERVVEYMKGKYGANKVAYVSTFACTKGRGSVRDVSRVFDVPLVEVDKIAKQILVRSGGDARADFTIEDTVTLFEKAKDFNTKFPYVVENAKVIEGLTKTKGVHAAGLVVDTDDLFTGEKCVLMHGKGGELVVNWDKHDLEYMGMMKIDALGLKTLSVLSHTSAMVKARRNIDIDYRSIPLDDPLVLETFRKADSAGIFQFGSAGMMQYLREFQPVNFTELYQVNALWRPGTLRSGLADEFIKLKDGLKKPEYVCPQIKDILKETYGIVLFQEQVMYILNRLGDIPWRTTDVIRKVISKSEGQEKFETFRQQFLEGVKRLKSMPESDAQKLFSLMKFFGSYSFNKSHSVEYTILGYWTMWLKVHYPIEFYCASLQRADDKVDISELLSDAMRKGIVAALPDINKSSASWTIDDDHTVRAGFNIIKGVSDRIADEIVRARESVGGQFKDFWQFRDAVTKRIINVAKVKVLMQAKTFSSIMTEDDRIRMLGYIAKHKSLPGVAAQLQEISSDADMSLEDDTFNFEVTTDYYTGNKKLIDTLTAQMGVKKLVLLSQELEKGSFPHTWFVGKFDEMKYGYRQRIDRKSEMTDTKGYASDLGGVYGVFRDDTFHAYCTVADTLYRSNKKAMIEDAAGRMLLLQGDKPAKIGNVFAHRAYLMEDLKHGKFDDVELNGIITDAAESEDLKLLAAENRACELCEGRKDCQTPVPFTAGTFGRAMIVAEAPGEDEDNQGKPLVGRSGKVLWQAMEKFGLERSMFHVSNVLKCRPRENRITDQKVVNACGATWLKLEIEVVQPKLILSLGKTAIRYFTGDKDASIMAHNGQVDWNEKIGAWIVWGIHPASVLYTIENKQLLEEAVAKFYEMFARLVA